MRRELFGAAKYAAQRRKPIQPCSTENWLHWTLYLCNQPYPAHYHSCGLHFCVQCWRRFLLVEYSLRLFPECLYSASKSLKYTRLQPWLDLAICGDDEMILQTFNVFRDEMVVLNIDERML